MKIEATDLRFREVCFKFFLDFFYTLFTFVP